MNKRMKRVVGIGVALCLGFLSVHADFGILSVLAGRGLDAAVSLLKENAVAIFADDTLSDAGKKEALVSLLNEVAQSENETLIRKAIAMVMVLGDAPLLSLTTDAVRESEVAEKISDTDNIIVVTTKVILANDSDAKDAKDAKDDDGDDGDDGGDDNDFGDDDDSDVIDDDEHATAV